MAADVAIVGAGYVGMPLARVFADAGKKVVLVDVNQEVVDGVNRGESHIGDVDSDVLKALVDSGQLSATSDYDVLAEADAILIALPTPLSTHREPDLSIVEGAVRQIATRLRKGQLVVLESTTYPGTTRERLQPILESSGLKAGDGFLPRVLAGACRSRPHRLDDEEHAEARRRPRLPRARSAPPSSTAQRWTRSCPCRLRRRRR